MEKYVEAKFGNSFSGKLETENLDVYVGGGKNELAPYDMLYGALATCLYATILGIAKKQRSSFTACNVKIKGNKGDGYHKVHVTFDVKGCTNEQGLKKAAQLATKYCSVYQTLSHTAIMSYEVLCN